MPEWRFRLNSDMKIAHFFTTYLRFRQIPVSDRRPHIYIVQNNKYEQSSYVWTPSASFARFFMVVVADPLVTGRLRPLCCGRAPQESRATGRTEASEKHK